MTFICGEDVRACVRACVCVCVCVMQFECKQFHFNWNNRLWAFLKKTDKVGLVAFHYF